ncbi:hypothetical protein EBQ26_02995 [Allofranklinella schreckenbergeri]|uniref:Uncharacterized protein n=1 Tax=Allofranklinella schreckenbergeri TaxID=1076744 RepID=A0A3M6QA72_9BURK|nr:DUF6806 family protein [Allofranklinella schreckenbergeri]RMW95559.1 hypothetical protein EBQ25_11645 [Allofranklinella schreckenbergeri]RMX00058.1 hypothetical protein EBQ26_02995 [Allofranklinella schreckenbergeri]RMX06244.1 hypothetical protein EBQ24_11170 [Allofranklinella schreckenbergeri]RRD43498.1 hypothetical protein EII18_02830 [Comamonadaceae bacterium OH3737_COT-264]
MTNDNDTPFEIHVHGQVFVRRDVSFSAIEEALKPMWQYAGARSLAAAAVGYYEEEPGIEFIAREHVLQMCWTVRGGEDFRQVIDEVCMNLNDLADRGCVIEVTFYDRAWDDMDEDEEDEANARGEQARDDFFLLFVGPTPSAIMQVQRDLLVQDVVSLMERHFEAAELTGVVNEIDRLFTGRFDALVSSLELGRPPRGESGGSGGSSGHGGGRRPPRHLH